MKYARQQPGCLLIDIAGMELGPEDKELLQHPLVAGVILFERNYDHPEQLKALTDSIYACRSPLMIGVDQEGGRVQRFHQGFTDIPAMRTLAADFKQDPMSCKQQLRSAIETQARELTRAGINVNFAPVLDLDDGVSAVIGERSLGASAEQVIALAQVVIPVMAEFHLPAIGKHFPGHGGVSSDSHITSPVDTRDLSVISRSDMAVFAELAPFLDAVMTAHVQFPAVDTMAPTYSKVWLHDILRQQLRFKGMVFSDDLSMRGASSYDSAVDRCWHALEAGCDLLLLCNDRQATIEVLDGLSLNSLPIDRERIAHWVYQLRGPWHE